MLHASFSVSSISLGVPDLISLPFIKKVLGVEGIAVPNSFNFSLLWSHLSKDLISFSYNL